VTNSIRGILKIIPEGWNRFNDKKKPFIKEMEFNSKANNLVL
jgi:hypothetical protein